MRAAFLAVTLLTLAAAVALVGGAAGTFGDQAQVGGNAFTTDTLDPPTGLAASVVGSDIQLNWTPTVDTYATGYRVLRGTTSGGPYTEIATITPYTATTYTDTSPGPGSFYYVLRSYYENWESADSNEASASPIGGQYATSAIASSEWDSLDWGTIQATGAPDLWPTECGDLPWAWAPLSDGADPEWLEVSYSTRVYATGLSVYETFSTGFIYQVDLIDTSNAYHTIWTGTDTTGCPGEFSLSFAETSYQVDGIRIYTQINGWEEIDAVKLVGHE